MGEDYGLSKVCSGEIVVDTVSGDHETCVSDFQEDIASLISSRVSKSNSQNYSNVSVRLGTWGTVDIVKVNSIWNPDFEFRLMDQNLLYYEKFYKIFYQILWFSMFMILDYRFL